MITNHDRHLFLLMILILQDFNKNKIKLPTLIEKLDSLFNETSPTKSPWRQNFYKNWVNLESIYAGTLHENRAALTEHEDKVLQSSIESLQRIVDKELIEYSRFIDSTVSKVATIIDEHWLMCPDCIDAWETSSQDPMVICPKCNQAFHNPRNKQK